MNPTSPLFNDLYQFNMASAHFKKGTYNDTVVFELYFRKAPFGGVSCTFVGLSHIIDFLKSFRISEERLTYLQQSNPHFTDEFINELRNLRFTGTLRAVREGEIVFPNTPLIQIEARAIEAQILETPLLTFVNHETLIATKASRIVETAGSDTLLEFGTRRAHGETSALWGTRAAYVAGFHGTSNPEAGFNFGIPVKGTHAHALVQFFDTELEAFRAYADADPENVTLLIDTYDTIASGLPNAISVAKELETRGYRMKGVRIDSGDLAYLAKETRKKLDAEGLSYVKIVASNDLDEHLIADLKQQGAPIDIWGVGTKLITAYDCPALGAVYKIVAREQENEFTPKIKLSSNVEKTTLPGKKKVYRILDLKTGKSKGDLLALSNEIVDPAKPIRLLDPENPIMNNIRLREWTFEELLVDIFIDGVLVYDQPTLEESRAFHHERKSLFWSEIFRRNNPAKYWVNLTNELIDLRNDMIEEIKEKL